MKKTVSLLLAGMMIFSGCANMNNMQKGTAYGAGGGAAVGAAAGGLIGGDGKSAVIGAIIGAAIGAGTGAVIGNKMDKKAEELAAIENAKVEKVTDVNGLQAIKVTFNSGILFATGKSELSAVSKNELLNFVNKMRDMPDADLSIYGHTDNTGSDAINERLSAERAQAVASYLQKCGMAANRMTAQGLSYKEPIASNDTAEGRAQNRRVEIFIYATEAMVQSANRGY
ncbi:MAG: OmpA family protein [Bacteroidales bacterium]|nr:OmpA family protein [Bacteroidales bacterium]